jgi:cytochrome c oxidase assembly protein subunit 15
MVVVGGVTRLTGSGLSMVTWEPFSGAIPPLSNTDWHRAFEAYQRSPQYRLVNAGMSLAEFQRIFFWEYVHRLLGRVLGVAFVVPLLYFAVTKALPRALLVRLTLLFGLGGLQGLVGWLMVASGLVDRPNVSHYRLAAHLSLALSLLSLLLWTLLELGGRTGVAPRPVRFALRAFLGVLGLQIVYGAFTAGLHAGIGYNTFPMMHGQWIPREVLAIEPVWRNAFENRATVQLLHRAFGAAVVLGAGGLVGLSRGSSRRVRRAIGALAVAVAVQFSLGVATLLARVPVSLGALHQLGACLLLLVTIWAIHEAGPRPARAASPRRGDGIEARLEEA